MKQRTKKQTKKHTPPLHHTCLNCTKAITFQRSNNPIIATCTRNPKVRQIATTPHHCENFHKGKPFRHLHFTLQHTAKDIQQHIYKALSQQ